MPATTSAAPGGWPQTPGRGTRHRRWRSALTDLHALTRATALAALATLAGSAWAGSITFNYTGSPGTWTVPAGVTTIDVDAVGGGGGRGLGSSLPSSTTDGGMGGAGARVQVSAITVTPGDVLSYTVGGGGQVGNTLYHYVGNGGGSTNLGGQGGQPWLIAGGGGGGAFLYGGATSGGGAGGDGCALAAGGTLGAGGKGEPSKNLQGEYVGGDGGDGGASGAGGGGGAGITRPGTTGGAGYGGAGGSESQNLTFSAGGFGVGAGVGANASLGGAGGGGFGGGGSGGSTARTDQPGGAYGGHAGGGAGGSLWPGMSSNTANSPTCIPAGNGSTGAFTTGGNGSLTITWVDPVPHTLSYNGNGSDGGSAPADGSAVNGEAVTLPANTFTRTLYSFSGWNTTANGSGTLYAAGASFTMPAVDTTLYAQWVATGFSGTTVPSPGGGGAAGTGTASFTSADGGDTCGFDLAQTAFVAAPAGQDMPQGMFQFRLTGCNPGATAHISITWPQPLSAQYMKWGRATSAAAADSLLAPTNLSVSGTTVRFDVTDGALGDDDWTADGTITDPSGPVGAIPLGDVTGVPTLGELALALLALAAGGLGVRGLRRRGRGG
ncbi:MAG: InlB B-repeat-containing protein [Ottowia sp.]|nr:InlB B-repeat-containing protein [Ottowia sp.]